MDIIDRIVNDSFYLRGKICDSNFHNVLSLNFKINLLEKFYRGEYYSRNNLVKSNLVNTLNDVVKNENSSKSLSEIFLLPFKNVLQCYNFSENEYSSDEIEELIIIANQMNYLDNIRLIEILVLIKHIGQSKKLPKELILIAEGLKIKNTLFDTFLYMGLLEPVKILHNSMMHDNNEIFILSCEYGNIDICKWIYNIIQKNGDYTKVLHENDTVCFKIACRNGFLHLVCWLVSLKWNQSIQYIQRIYNMGIILSCENGHLELAKKLYFLGADPSYLNNSAFFLSCSSGSFKIVKWLYSLGNIKEADLLFVFKDVCENNYLDMALWIYKITKGSVSIVIEYEKFKLFTNVFEKEFIELSRWIYFLFKNEIENFYPNKYSILDIKWS